jgi:DNA-binding CsgD family transcriptional regulator
MIFGARIAGGLAELMIRQAQPDRHPFPELTTREREILDLIARGMDNPTIARRLFLAPKTVRNNICMIFSKMGAADRSQAIVWARQAGLGHCPAALLSVGLKQVPCRRTSDGWTSAGLRDDQVFALIAQGFSPLIIERW